MEYEGFKISKESIDKLFPKKDIDILGYESPITVIMGQMRMEQENNIYKAIQDYGVDVDKEELIKALQYDRNQYEKGYINGYNAKASEVAREIFEEIEKSIADLEYQAKTSRKTVKVEELKAQCDWILHEVIPKTLAELKKKYTEEGK